MPALNFQARFAALIESGQKRQTIRATRKRPIVRGDVLYLYTGQRSKHSRLLGVASCLSAEEISIEENSCWLDHALNSEECQALATADGFESWAHMVDWFRETHGLPFAGQLIRWGIVGWGP